MYVISNSNMAGSELAYTSGEMKDAQVMASAPNRFIIYRKREKKLDLK